MAEFTKIARPYAQAVFDLADASGALPAWSEMLGVLAGIAEHAEVRALLGNPGVTQNQLVDVVASLAGDSLSSEGQQLLRTLVANGRLEAAPEVKELFEVLRHEREGTVDADVLTAFPLDDVQLAELVDQLESRFKRKVRPQVQVDSTLIGGVRVAVGDEVIDNSVRGKLDAMAAALKV